MSLRGVFVYVIQSACGHIKVGTAKNVEKRLRGLQGANPHQLRIAFVSTSMTRTKAEQVEFEAHHRLFDKHISGEWFLCTPQEACDAITLAATYVRNRRGDLAYHPHLKLRRNLRAANPLGGA